MHAYLRSCSSYSHLFPIISFSLQPFLQIDLCICTLLLFAYKLVSKFLLLLHELLLLRQLRWLLLLRRRRLLLLLLLLFLLGILLRFLFLHQLFCKSQLRVFS